MRVAYPPPPAIPIRPRGTHGSRLRRPILLGSFAGILAVVLLIAFVGIKKAAPPAPKPVCPGGPCGKPPIRPLPPGTAQALVAGQVFSGALGFHFEFNQDPRFTWKVGNKTANSIQLTLGGAVLMVVDGFPASTSPQAAVNKEVNAAKGLIPNIALDAADTKTILVQPSVGYRRGVGAIFGGTLQTPQGPGGQVAAVIQAATDGKATIAVAMLTDPRNFKAAATVVDSVMNTLRFPTETQP